MGKVIHNEELLQAWAKEAVDKNKHPLKVVIEIESNGDVSIEQFIDGRKLRGKWLNWQCDQFENITGLLAPEKRTTKAFTKMWAHPFDELVRQAVFVGGVRWDSIKDPEEKYNQLHALTFLLLLRDTVKKMKEDGLNYDTPNSMMKVGRNVAVNGHHYRSAMARLGGPSSNGTNI